MSPRIFVAFLLSASVLSAGAYAQDKPPATAPAGAVGTVIQREVQGLSAEAFADREAALKRLQGLVAEQLKQRAQIQEVLNAFQLDLVKQQHALAMVSDEEAQAQIAGLLDMERGLSGWTIQTMSEPAERRKILLDWGLTKENAPALARAYSDSLRIRLDGIKQLAKVTGDGADWSLGRMINDKEAAVRAAAMAVCWARKPNPDIINALWFRAVTGPLARDNSNGPMGMMGGRMGMFASDIGDLGMGGQNTVKVDFPGGDPMEFDDSSDANEFTDSQLASDVLVHLNSPLVGDKVKALVEERAKAGKSLSLANDPEWTLVSHRLVETYAVKESIPLLANEALGSDSEQMGGDMNGRSFMWSRRTMAIGTLSKLIAKDPADFDLIKAHDSGNPRGWMWAVDVNPQVMMGGNGDADGAAVRAFYAFWKDHHAEYGVKETPSNASVPPVPQPGVPGRRFRGGPIQIEPMQVPVPLIGPADAPGAAPGAPGEAAPPNPPVQIMPVRPLPMIRNGAAG